MEVCIGLISVLVLIGISLAVMSSLIRENRKRAKDYEMFCAARGYSFTKMQAGGGETYANLVPILWRGRSGYGISGHLGRHPFTAFEYIVSAPPDPYPGLLKREWFAIMMWEAPELALPRFLLTTKGSPGLERMGPAKGSSECRFPRRCCLLGGVSPPGRA